MATDYFLKLDGITGESTDATHKGQIELHSFSWGASNVVNIGSATGGAGAGKVQFHDLSITTAVSKASPSLFLMMASGTHAATGMLSIRKAGGTQLDYLTYSLTTVFVSSYSTAGANGDSIPTEQFTFQCAAVAMSYSPQNADGSLGSAIKTGWNVTTNQKI
jgi:type VI secretion system secreted protein Hcp